MRNFFSLVGAIMTVSFGRAERIAVPGKFVVHRNECGTLTILVF